MIKIEIKKWIQRKEKTSSSSILNSNEPARTDWPGSVFQVYPSGN